MCFVVGLKLGLLGERALAEAESLVVAVRRISCRGGSREECDTAYGVASSVA